MLFTKEKITYISNMLADENTFIQPPAAKNAALVEPLL
jgi:hypothetical protein